jgi:hypothetical protein
MIINEGFQDFSSFILNNLLFYAGLNGIYQIIENKESNKV